MFVFGAFCIALLLSNLPRNTHAQKEPYLGNCLCTSLSFYTAMFKAIHDVLSFLRAVLFASLLLRKTMAARSKVTVIYATETGKSETLARNLCSLFSCAFNTKVRKYRSLKLNGR